jgi:hypothetical protein
MNDEMNPSLFPYTYRTARWQTHKFFTVVSGDGSRISAVLRDFSEEGLGADLASPLDLGQVVELIFPDFDSDGTMSFEAQVVRIEGRRYGFLFYGSQEPFLRLKALGKTQGIE